MFLIFFSKSKIAKMESLRKKIVIIGGGTSGVSIANFLSRYLTSSTEISLIEPQENHFFQPSWTLIGAGLEKGSNEIGWFRHKYYRPLKDRLS